MSILYILIKYLINRQIKKNKKKNGAKKTNFFCITRRSQHIEPIEGIKVWLLVEYLSDILGYPSKY